MKIPKHIQDAFGATVEDIIKSKSKQGEKQTRTNTAVEAPDVVTMSIDECKTLCKAAKIVYVKGYEERVLKYTCSDDSVDRMGDIIKQDGWDLTNFKSNPVIMANHNYGEYPVGSALKVGIEDNKLKMHVLFAGEDVSKDADKAYRLAKSGFMKAGSVGFIPKDSSSPSQKEKEELGMTPWGMIYNKNELLEFSVCGVPANANAIQESIKKGLTTKSDFVFMYGDKVVKELEGEDDTSEDSTDDTSDTSEDTDTNEDDTSEESSSNEDDTSEDNNEPKPDEEKSVIPDTMKEMLDDYVDKKVKLILEEKSGAVLSKKNKESISKAIEGMDSAITALKSLLEKAEPSIDTDDNDTTDKSLSTDSGDIDIDLDNISELDPGDPLYSEDTIINIDV